MEGCFGRNSVAFGGIKQVLAVGFVVEDAAVLIAKVSNGFFGELLIRLRIDFDGDIFTHDTRMIVDTRVYRILISCGKEEVFVGLDHLELSVRASEVGPGIWGDEEALSFGAFCDKAEQVSREFTSAEVVTRITGLPLDGEGMEWALEK